MIAGAKCVCRSFGATLVPWVVMPDLPETGLNSMTALAKPRCQADRCGHASALMIPALAPTPELT